MEDRFFFNPYGFPAGFGNNFPPNMVPPPNITGNVSNKLTPKEFYENQYFYYRYLNEALDYQIKNFELSEKMNRTNTSNNKNL